MNSKTVEQLVKDICNRTETKYQPDVDYIKTCLNIAYWQGVVDTNKIWNKQKVQTEYFTNNRGEVYEITIQ